MKKNTIHSDDDDDADDDFFDGSAEQFIEDCYDRDRRIQDDLLSDERYIFDEKLMFDSYGLYFDDDFSKGKVKMPSWNSMTSGAIYDFLNPPYQDSFMSLIAYRKKIEDLIEGKLTITHIGTKLIKKLIEEKILPKEVTRLQKSKKGRLIQKAAFEQMEESTRLRIVAFLKEEIVWKRTEDSRVAQKRKRSAAQISNSNEELNEAEVRYLTYLKSMINKNMLMTEYYKLKTRQLQEMAVPNELTFLSTQIKAHKDNPEIYNPEIYAVLWAQYTTLLENYLKNI